MTDNTIATVPSRTAILLIAHGSRRAEANDDLRHVADQLGNRNAAEVIVASYLELATPSIDGGAAECIAQGATVVKMLPYFLSPGVHVQQDLEAHRVALARQFPQCSFVLCEPLGRHPLLIEILMERATDVMETGAVMTAMPGELRS